MAFPADPPNLYDGAVPMQQPETLPLEAILRRYVEEGHRALRLAFPAAIVAVDADQTVDVQPLLQVRYTNQAPSNLPQVRGVPVVMPRGAGYRVSYPLSVGDTGLVVVASRSLDAWLAGDGGLADPGDTRCHALADAVFMPGLVPDARQTTDTGRDLVLSCGDSSLRLQPGGTVTLNNTALELVHVLHRGTQALIDTLQAVQQLQVLTPLGPASVLATSVAQLAQIQAQATRVLADLQTFEGK